MTAIIIVVVVALVFFVSICVITFMVWKHETEMRTDSLKAIEKRLEALGGSLAEEGPITDHKMTDEIRRDISMITQEEEPRHMFKQRGADPFGWMRSSQENSVVKPVEVEDPPVSTKKEPEPELEIVAATVQDNSEEHNVQVSEMKSDKIKDRERIYAEIDLDFAEIRDLVSEMKKIEEDQMTEVVDESVDESTEQTEKIPEERQEEIQLPDFDQSSNEFYEEKKSPMQYDVGRSGKKYTATELETLIKE